MPITVETREVELFEIAKSRSGMGLGTIGLQSGCRNKALSCYRTELVWRSNEGVGKGMLGKSVL